jgi:hypothetical protein
VSDNPLQSFVPKVLVSSRFNNKDIVNIETTELDENNFEYKIYERVLQPSAIVTENNLIELQPEISEVYPFKIVPPVTETGVTRLLSPSITTAPTASQNYYLPLYEERYNHDVLRLLVRDFVELPDPGDRIFDDVVDAVEEN